MGFPEMLAPESKEKANIEMSEWADCSSARFAKEWKMFREAIQVAGGEVGEDLEVLTLADVIVRRYEWVAMDWAARASESLSGFCSLPYVFVSPWSFNHSSFMPAMLFDRVDEIINRSIWSPWLGFCLAGYSTALYLRARGLDRA